MFVVGITGGIASGKSLVSNILESKGVITVDADKISKVVIEKPEVSHALVERYDEQILDPDGKIDRRLLGKMVFGNTENLNNLNDLMLPSIVEIIDEHMEFFSKTLPPNQVVVIDAPLLIETGLQKKADMVVLVKAAPKKRLERLVQKGFTIEEAQNRMEAQLDDEEKEKLADYIIENDGSIEELEAKVEKLWEKINHLAAF